MKRWLANFVSILSLMICLASVAAWMGLGRMRVGFSVAPTAHTHFATLAVERLLVVRFSSVPRPVDRGVEIQRGNLKIGSVTPNTSDVGHSTSGGRATHDRVWKIADFAVARRAYPYASLSGRAPYLSVHTVVFLPYWLIILVSILPPAWWLLVLRHRRLRAARSTNGQCVNCGYDLRASPERCPECGTQVAIADPGRRFALPRREGGVESITRDIGS